MRDGMAWGKFFPAICMLALGVPAIAQHQPTITTIDAPNAGKTSSYGTRANVINTSGVIAGFYADSTYNAFHSYVRAKDGTITEFDAPGAGAVGKFPPFPLSMWNPGTYAIAIDAVGAVAGFYVDSGIVKHGYLRTPDGAFTAIDAPNAGTAAHQGTNAANMNVQGTIAGYYIDANNMQHGFVRTRDAAITEFDVPVAASGPGLGTTTYWSQCLNEAGAITGSYFDSNGAAHGYVRNPDGTFSTFDVPGAGTAGGQGTYSWAINPSGATTGAFYDASGNEHGYLRTSAGEIITFDVPGAAATEPECNDPAGQVAGLYWDASGARHGFLRAVDGKFTTFDAVPGALTTFPLMNNPGDTIVGFYIDSGHVWHGFVRK